MAKPRMYGYFKAMPNNKAGAPKWKPEAKTKICKEDVNAKTVGKQFGPSRPDGLCGYKADVRRREAHRESG